MISVDEITAIYSAEQAKLAGLPIGASNILSGVGRAVTRGTAEASRMATNVLPKGLKADVTPHVSAAVRLMRRNTTAVGGATALAGAGATGMLAGRLTAPPGQR